MRATNPCRTQFSNHGKQVYDKQMFWNVLEVPHINHSAFNSVWLIKLFSFDLIFFHISSSFQSIPCEKSIFWARMKICEWEIGDKCGDIVIHEAPSIEGYTLPPAPSYSSHYSPNIFTIEFKYFQRHYCFFYTPWYITCMRFYKLEM